MLCCQPNVKKKIFITISCPAVVLFLDFLLNFSTSRVVKGWLRKESGSKESESSASLVSVCGFVVLPDVNLVKCS